MAAGPYNYSYIFKYIIIGKIENCYDSYKPYQPIIKCIIAILNANSKVWFVELLSTVVKSLWNYSAE